MASFFILFKTIIFLLAILFLVRLTLNSVNKLNHFEKKNMKIIESLPISKDSSIVIVYVYGKYYLMSLSQNGTQMIKELSEDQIREVRIQKMVENEFRNIEKEKTIQVFLTKAKSFFKKEIKDEEKN